MLFGLLGGESCSSVPAVLWGWWRGRRHCSVSVCGPQTDLCLQLAAAVLVKQGSFTGRMNETLAAELGLEGDRRCFAKAGFE